MKRQKKASKKKMIAAALAAMLIMLGGTYIGLTMFFENHYFYNTIINGENYSYRTPVEAEMMLYAGLAGYTLEIQGRRGVTDSILSEEIAMEYQWDGSLLRIKEEQRPWQWILGFFREYSYDLYDLVVYDEEKLEQRLEELSFYGQENVKAYREAYISYFPQQKRYKIIEEDPGTELKEETVRERVREALDNLETSLDLEETGCYIWEKSGKGNKELAEALRQANVYAATDITYDWNGSQVFVNGDVIRYWVEIEKDRVTLQEEKIREFVRRQAEAYDTYGRNKRFQTTDGREVELNTQACGWQTDVEAEAEVLIKAVKSGEAIEKEPVHIYTEPAPWQVEIADSYVEMDLSAQHLYVYVEGAMVLESDFVSGNAARGWSTPAGVFGLTYKTRNAVLRGENYATPVSYWMPFNGNIGMHDATWRSSFGGEIYRSNGSHGCINLPYEKAKIIYEYMYTGFPIVCYY